MTYLFIKGLVESSSCNLSKKVYKKYAQAPVRTASATLSLEGAKRLSF